MPVKWVLFREMMRTGKRVEESDWGMAVGFRGKGKAKAKQPANSEVADGDEAEQPRRLREVGVLQRWVRSGFEARKGIKNLADGQEALRQGYIVRPFRQSRGMQCRPMPLGVPVAVAR